MGAGADSDPPVVCPELGNEIRECLERLTESEVRTLELPSHFRETAVELSKSHYFGKLRDSSV